MEMTAQTSQWKTSADAFKLFQSIAEGAEHILVFGQGATLPVQSRPIFTHGYERRLVLKLKGTRRGHALGCFAILPAANIANITYLFLFFLISTPVTTNARLSIWHCL